MVFYNSQRPHSNNNYRTPDAKEAEYYSKNSTWCPITRVQKWRILFFRSHNFTFLEIRVPSKIKFNNAEALSNKGIKEKPIEMSYHKGSDFNRFFRWWRQQDSNLWPLACEANALPAEPCLQVKNILP